MLSVGIAQAQPISQIYAFGHSLTDSGNFLGAENRYTDPGNRWIETLGSKLGLAVTPARAIDISTLPTTVLPNGRNNYALGGTALGDVAANDFATQLSWFKHDHPRIDRHALVALWMGFNDTVAGLEQGLLFEARAVGWAKI